MALFPSDPKRQKQLVIGLVPLLGLVAYVYFFHGGTTEEIESMESRLERLEASNLQARSTAAEGGPELERQLELFTAHVARLERLIPTSEEVPELLHTINVQAQSIGVDLARFEPGAEQIGPYYTQRLYEITVIGAYHDIGRFLTAVGSLPRIINPIDLELRVNNADADADAATLEADLRLESYVLPSGSGEATENGNA